MSKIAEAQEAIKAALLAIQKRDGTLKASVLVRDARNPKHPAHREFEWDNSKAGDAYRILQARELIRVHHEWIDMNGEGRARVPVFISPSFSGDESGYVKTSEATQETIRKLALRDLKAFLDRYRGMLKLVGMVIPADTEIIQFLGLDVAAETKKPGRGRRIA